MDFSDPLKKLWNVWEIRFLILCSMVLQILLIILAPLRKGKWSKMVSPFIWLFYLLADSVAVLALGNLINAQGEDSHCHDNKQSIGCANHSELMAFWAPFLLLHLGGPDNISAFAIEDNELWLRHALLLIFEVLMTSYIFVRALPMKRLLAPFLLMFMTGIIKYGERIRALYLASMNGFMDSCTGWYNRCGFNENEILTKINKLRDIKEAHLFFKLFKGLIVNMIFPFYEVQLIRPFFKQLSAKDAFKVVDVELGFIYDLLYTKAGVLHSSIGYILRAICSISIWTSLLLFIFSHKNNYKKFDVGITYALLIGAIVVDVIALMMLILSDWANVSSHHLMAKVSVVQKIFPFLTRPRWSETMLQYNFIDINLIKRWTCVHWTVEKFVIENLLDFVKYAPRARVTKELKEFIFEELKKKSEFAGDDLKTLKKLCSSRGDWVLKYSDCPLQLEDLKWSIGDVEFDQSLLMWHIATDICYNTDECSDTTSHDQEYKEMGKNIADYMLYLLVTQNLLVSSIVGNKFHGSYEEAQYFFFSEISKTTLKEARGMLLEKYRAENTSIFFDSILAGAVKLAKQLNEVSNKAKKWRMISVVWVEMLSYTATQFTEVSRGAQLSKGGELVMFVRFLMFHLGLAEQISDLIRPEKFVVGSFIEIEECWGDTG